MTELLIARGEQRVQRHLFELREVFFQHFADGIGGSIVIVMRAARGFGDLMPAP